MLIIGKIVKAQGIKGEVKIIPITDDVLRFNKLKKATVKGQEMTVESSRVQNDCAYVKFKGVDTRNDAELLQNEYVSVAREDAVKLPENTWFIVDILGSKVFVDDKDIGTLTDVMQNAAVDVEFYLAGNSPLRVVNGFAVVLTRSYGVARKSLVGIPAVEKIAVS